MKRVTHSAVSPARKLRVGGIALLLAFVNVGAVGVVHAEDEDTSASVYLVFDPETGEFVTQDDPDAALSNQTGLEGSQHGRPDGDKDTDGSGTSTEGGLSTAVLIGIAAAILLGGGAFLAMRRRSS